jgi:hypothetical protein
MAMQGDSTILRFFLNRVVPPPKDDSVNLGPLKLGTMEELLESQELVLAELAAGRLTPDQARQINELLESRRLLMETNHMERRLRSIERLLEEKGTKGQVEPIWLREAPADWLEDSD